MVRPSCRQWSSIHPSKALSLCFSPPAREHPVFSLQRHRFEGAVPRGQTRVAGAAHSTSRTRGHSSKAFPSPASSHHGLHLLPDPPTPGSISSLVHHPRLQLLPDPSSHAPSPLSILLLSGSISSPVPLPGSISSLVPHPRLYLPTQGAVSSLHLSLITPSSASSLCLIWISGFGYLGMGDPDLEGWGGTSGVLATLLSSWDLPDADSP